MITCPSCNHQNPEGSLQCENCYTPLPATVGCPNCGASVQTDATFCGQCGFNLQAENPPISAPLEETAIGTSPDLSIEEISLPEEMPLAEEISLPEEMSLTEPALEILPETSMSSPIQSPWDEVENENMTIGQKDPLANSVPELDTTEVIEVEALETHLGIGSEAQASTSVESDALQASRDLEMADGASEVQSDSSMSEVEELISSDISSPDLGIDVQELETHPNTVENVVPGATQLQIQTANLLHLQSNTTIELPSDLDVVHLGKPNGQIPPDIDVSGFPDSEVVSRVHADIRIEGDAYYVEDVGSSNGTYVNHTPLVRGNRHKLRTGDRIVLGKGDLVTFIFQMS